MITLTAQPCPPETSPSAEHETVWRDSVESSASSSTYAVVTERYFVDLVSQDPDELLRLVESAALEPYQLTFAAETAGTIADGEKVIPVLLRLLDHQSPVVREGAIYGLANHLTANVIDRLRRIERQDASAGVREAATETLSDPSRPRS